MMAFTNPPEEDDEKTNLIKEYLSKKYNYISNDNTELNAARDEQKNAKIGSLLAQGLNSIVTARGKASGYQDNSGNFFENLGRVKDDGVSAAEQNKKQKLESLLMGDKLDRQDIERSQQDKSFANFQEDRISNKQINAEDRERKKILQGREDSAYNRDVDNTKTEDDPMSDVSKSYQTLAQKMMPGRDFSTVSASKLKSLVPALEKTYQIDEARKSRLESAQALAGQKAEAREYRQSDLAERQAEAERVRAEKRQEKLDDEARKKSEKVNKEDEEFNQRYDNINKNLNDLDAIIEDKGTFELFGDTSDKVDKRLYDIALDYAKIVDPTSVAREGEVAAAQKYLLPIKGLGVKNSTARSMIQDMRETLSGRMKAKNSNRKNSQESSGQMNKAPSENPGKSWKDF